MAVAGQVIVGLYGNHISHGLQTSDATAPVFSAGPSSGVITSSSIQILATMTDATPPITLYAVAVADGAAAPSEAQIQAGTDSAGAAAPNNSAVAVSSGDSVAFAIGGLTASTAYDIYYTAVDGSTNASTAAKLDLSTIAASAASGTVAIGAFMRRRRR